MAENSYWLQTNPASALPFPRSEWSVYSTVITVHKITYVPNNSEENWLFFQGCLLPKEGLPLSGIAEVCRLYLHCIVVMSAPVYFNRGASGAAAQPKQRTGLVRAMQVFQAVFAVCAEFYSVLANLLSISTWLLWSSLVLLWYIVVGLLALCERVSLLCLWITVCCDGTSGALCSEVCALSLSSQLIPPWVKLGKHSCIFSIQEHWL